MILPLHPLASSASMISDTAHNRCAMQSRWLTLAGFESVGTSLRRYIWRQQTSLAADARDRFTPVPCFAFDLPLGPAHAQQADDLVALPSCSVVHGGAFTEKSEPGVSLSRGLF